jgi:hypothetical protein
MAANPPTPQRISALLKRAGFERAVIKMRGGRSGFDAKQGLADGSVVVRHRFWAMGATNPDRYREWLERYSAVIVAAGYSTVIGVQSLTVTAGKDER